MNSNGGQKGNKSEQEHYSLILFVIDDGDNSRRARKNLKRLCEKWVPDQHDVKIVDVLEDFQTALDHNILLTPSVVVISPAPRKVIHGDLSDGRKFAEALNLHDKDSDD